MRVELKLDETCAEPRIVVVTDRVTDEIDALIRRLADEGPGTITGFRENTAKLLEPPDILRIYAQAGKVRAVTDEGEYALRLRLYELEERLDRTRFVRISHSEIINLKKVRSFDLSLSGTICATLCDGTAVYASRRYVAGLKKVLGI